MELSEFQNMTAANEIYAVDDPVGFLLHGIVGEAGVLNHDYKKHLRDNSSKDVFSRRAYEELGDLMWYIARLAAQLDLDLADIAVSNLEKSKDRWGHSDVEGDSLDSNAPGDQRFPDSFEIAFSDVGGVVQMYFEEAELGDAIDSNAHDDDGYRFHDVFHLAHASVLGWSPTLRSLLGRKRKFDDDVDRVEDGARAIFTEEAIVTVVFRHAEQHGFYDGVSHVESTLLTTISTMVSGLEVSSRSSADWETAILQGCEAFRTLKANNGGIACCDLRSRSLVVNPSRLA